MAEPFLSEIRIMSFNFAPKGWALCNGQFLPINQNQALFSLLGTTYGGNGQTNFALPNLRGRVPIHFGQRATRSARAAAQHAHTLHPAEMPTHTHVLQRLDGGRRAVDDPPATSWRQPSSNVYRTRRRNLDDADPGDDHQRRRQPAARQHAAVSWC